MAAFELNDFSPQAFQSGNVGGQAAAVRPPSTILENITCFKIYDSCRQQDCLDYSEIGPARAAESMTIGGHTINAGDIVIPPRDAASVTMDNLHIERITIVDKIPNCFRKGYWDVEIKYVMAYRLMFRGAGAEIIYTANCMSICSRKVTLFGSEGCDLFVSTDLFGGSGMFEAMPFVLAEGKAMCLSAAIIYDCYNHHNPDDRRNPSAVEVSIGLFSVVKLFRIVDLAVESRGFSIPDECEDTCPMNPCEYFDNLDFPMDIFAPPQKPEFLAGISGNIPSKKCKKEVHDCDCDCHDHHDHHR